MRRERDSSVGSHPAAPSRGCPRGMDVTVMWVPRIAEVIFVTLWPMAEQESPAGVQEIPYVRWLFSTR
eukprot:5512122-Prymnesium_polylepis.1